MKRTISNSLSLLKQRQQRTCKLRANARNSCSVCSIKGSTTRVTCSSMRRRPISRSHSFLALFQRRRAKTNTRLSRQRFRSETSCYPQACNIHNKTLSTTSCQCRGKDLHQRKALAIKHNNQVVKEAHRASFHS